MSRAQDIACILRSLQIITEAGLHLQRETLRQIWRNSSLTPVIQVHVQQNNQPRTGNPRKVVNIIELAKDSADRLLTVAHGLKVYTDLSLRIDQGQFIYTKNSEPEPPVQTSVDTDQNTVKKSAKIPVNTKPQRTRPIKLTESDKKLLKKLDMEHRAKLTKKAEREKEYERELEQNVISTPETTDKPKNVAGIETKQDDKTVKATTKVKVVPNPKSKQKLSENAKQRTVPSSRLGRMVSFGSLAAGLSLGTAAEYAKRTLGLGDQTSDSNLFLTKANMDRIVETLCKVRGAALKLGQILSIQDESVVNPELAKALERVRKSADFMPNWQVQKVMHAELGPFWRDNFVEFEEKPFAAASIGQVHHGTLNDGRDVAIKIQYPGVAKGIESDIDNLGGIMKMWNIFPKGMFLENVMVVAKRELAWEVDYVREAECTKKFKTILETYNDYYVPDVIDNLSTKQVFTTELLDGIPVDQCLDLDMEHREFIGQKIMELCLLEILKFRYMQTDPNWANFLYNPNQKQIMLLDFGASREYSKEFMDKYIQILKAAYDSNRDVVLKASRDLGFLSGYESKIMEDAHVDAVMILGEVFQTDGKYDFANQDMMIRIQNLAQTMLAHRLRPPPEEVYSLHRKLSGVFLLCTKLKVSVNCREKFIGLYNEYIKES